MELRGKHGTAIVHTDEVESSAISQIISLLNQPMASDAHVRIMPDCHAGAGCVIGYTARLTDQIVPNLIGVDIGCGVTAWRLGTRSEVGEKFDKLDKFIRKNIPSGRKIKDEEVDVKALAQIFHTVSNEPLENFDTSLREVCKRTGQSYDYVWRSLGTLGGGNHFIEIDKDDNDVFWLVVHSGSRNFGLKVAIHHQNVAKKEVRQVWTQDEIQQIIGRYKGKKRKEERQRIQKEIEELKGRAPVKIPTGLEYLEYGNAEKYFKDMKMAQVYAQVNRRLIGLAILTGFYKLKYKNVEIVESVHNYINFQDNIVRKGAISAHADERVIIPLNMADGIIVGTGKGNEDWNNSAPHGAGRRMSRRKAKESIDLGDFQRIMKARKVWSSTIDKHTIDEAPQAYKRAEHIIKYLTDTVDIEVQMKPVYNYKASE